MASSFGCRVAHYWLDSKETGCQTRGLLVSLGLTFSHPCPWFSAAAMGRLRSRSRRFLLPSAKRQNIHFNRCLPWVPGRPSLFLLPIGPTDSSHLPCTAQLIDQVPCLSLSRLRPPSGDFAIAVRRQIKQHPQSHRSLPSPLHHLVLTTRARSPAPRVSLSHWLRSSRLRLVLSTAQRNL